MYGVHPEPSLALGRSVKERSCSEGCQISVLPTLRNDWRLHGDRATASFITAVVELAKRRKHGHRD